MKVVRPVHHLLLTLRPVERLERARDHVDEWAVAFGAAGTGRAVLSEYLPRSDDEVEEGAAWHGYSAHAAHGRNLVSAQGRRERRLRVLIADEVVVSAARRRDDEQVVFAHAVRVVVVTDDAPIERLMRFASNVTALVTGSTMIPAARSHAPQSGETCVVSSSATNGILMRAAWISALR